MLNNIVVDFFTQTTIICRGFSSRHSRAEEEDIDLSLKIKMYHLDLFAGFHYRSTEKVRGPNQEYHGINIWQSHDMDNPESEYSNKTERTQCLRVYGRKKSKVILLEFKNLSVGIFIVCLTSWYLSVCHTYWKPLLSQHTEKYNQKQTSINSLKYRMYGIIITKCLNTNILTFSRRKGLLRMPPEDSVRSPITWIRLLSRGAVSLLLLK